MNSKKLRPPQSAYHFGRTSLKNDVDLDIHDAMYAYLTLDLGIKPAQAEERAQSELARKIPKSVLNYLTEQGISVTGRDVLELGAGLGGMSEELLLNGARLKVLEPGGAWAGITKARLKRHDKDFQFLDAFGEEIPLEAESVDLIVSLQVLEHVRDPRLVLSEAYRILRPGGYFYLACENYLAFVEPHYRIPWLPLFPKPIAKLYLRALGRSPQFLEEAITYTTYPNVIGECRKLGFLRPRDAEIAANLQTKTNKTWRTMRFIANITGNKGPLFLDDVRNMSLLQNSGLKDAAPPHLRFSRVF